MQSSFVGRSARPPQARRAGWLALPALCSTLALATTGCSSSGTASKGPCVASPPADLPPDPRVVADLAAICEGDARSNDQSFDPRAHDENVERWVRAALTTEPGKRLFATLRGGEGLVDRGALLGAEATRARLGQCTLAAELGRRARVEAERADVARACAGVAGVAGVAGAAADAGGSIEALPALETDAGKGLLTSLRAADPNARGSLLRRASQRLALASCPRADAWDAARGLAVESSEPASRPPVTATTAQVGYRIAADAEGVLEAAWPSIVACHRAALLADAPFEGTIRVVFQLGVPRLELRRGALSAGELPRCLRAALEAPPRSAEPYASSALSFRTPASRDTWTARPVSARVSFARIRVDDDRAKALAKGQVRMIPGDDPTYEAPIRSSAVRDALEHHAHRLRACFEQGRTRDPKLAGGTLEGLLVVDLSGAVESARRTGGTLAEKDVQSCVVGVLRSLAFTEPPSKARVSVTISIAPT